MMKFVIYKYGITKPALVSVNLERDNYLFLLTRSPADICKNCGEYYLS